MTLEIEGAKATQGAAFTAAGQTLHGCVVRVCPKWTFLDTHEMIGRLREVGVDQVIAAVALGTQGAKTTILALTVT